MKSHIRFLLVCLALCGALLLLAGCDLNFGNGEETTTASVTTTVFSPDVTTTAPPVTTTAPPVTTLPEPPREFEEAFVFDGDLAPYKVFAEDAKYRAAGEKIAAGAKLTVLDVAKGDYLIRIGNEDGLNAGDYHIFFDQTAIRITAADAAGADAAADAFLSYLKNGVMTMNQYVHILHRATAPADIQSFEDYKTRTELVGTTDKDPLSYRYDEEITFRLRLYHITSINATQGDALETCHSREPAGCHSFSYTVVADDTKETLTGSVSGKSGEFIITVPASFTRYPGSVRLSVNILDESGKKISCLYRGGVNGQKVNQSYASYIGGAIIEAERIHPSVITDEDEFKRFWEDRISEVVKCDPTNMLDNGNGKYNYFHINKADKAYLEETIKAYQAQGLTPPVAQNAIDAYLNSHDIFEVFLKSPGEYPAVAYVTVPKNAAGKSLPITVTLNAYSVRGPYSLGCSSAAINISMSPIGMPGVYYRDGKYTTPAYQCPDTKDYGTIAADYNHPEKAYLARMLQRNIQMLRFITAAPSTYQSKEESLDSWTPEDAAAFTKLREAYNGEIRFNTGGSMGGFQNVATAALTTLAGKNKAGKVVMPVKGTVLTIDLRCPWMCDPVAMAGRTDRLKGQGTSVGAGDLNKENLALFDTAQFARLLPSSCQVTLWGGFADTTCPSTGIIALWNNIKVKKTLHMSQNMDHSADRPMTMITYTRTADAQPAEAASEGAQ